MRLGVLSSYPPMECAIAQQTRTLLRRMTAQGVEATVVTYREAHEEPADPRIHVQPVLSRSHRGSRVGRLLRQVEPDAVWLQSQTFLHPRRFSSFPKALGTIPIVTTVHDAPLLPRLFHVTPFLRRQYRASAQLVCFSRVTASALVQRHGVDAARVRTVRLGVPLDDLSPAARNDKARERLGFEGRRVVAFQGFLNRGKGVEDLFHAFLAVRRRVPEARLVISGSATTPARRAARSADYVDGLRRLARELGLAQSVQFTGWVDDATRNAIVANADVVALPYVFSYQSLSLHTALALGAAVVASDIEGFRETVTGGREALLVPPGDPEALAAAIERLLADDGLNGELRRNARALAERDLSVERTVAAHLEAFRQALDEA